MKPICILLAAFLFCGGCKTNQEKGFYTLQKTGEQLSFPLNVRTKNFILALFVFKDKETGTEYLTFQNQGQNEILFYDINTCKLDFVIEPQVEGNNGVGFFDGYYIHNLDSIFLTIDGAKEIALIDRNAIVKDKMQYENSTDNIPLERFYSSSRFYHPIEIINNNLYIISGCNRWSVENPVTAFIRLPDKTVHAITKFRYPSFPGADNRQKKYGAEENMSRCFDGENFIYSFFFDENIQIASIDHEMIQEKKIKSKYIDKVKLLDDFGNLTFNDICENPNYGNLLFDKYRNVYYRIAYPETEVGKNIKGMELSQYGRKNFSIIILDKDFNLIGETLFPDYTYNSMLMFIREDGLYISDSHYLNPNFSDDILSFQRFDVVKEAV